VKAWQHSRLPKIAVDGRTRLFIISGKHKNKYCVFGGNTFYQSKIRVTVEDDENTELELHYTALEELGEDGLPVVLPVMDMTGRDITEGSYICYSVSSGRSSHALEIGKVVELTRTGSLKVRPIVHNGDKAMPSWRGLPVTVNDPFRTIKLPVDDKTMIMWIMQDFEEMAKTK
jgi:hypothetical protein